jgi:hypothetical protein
MAKKLKLGIIGMSEGNGHPYSWSAIFNGYNKQEMEKCPFPVIPEYLSRESYPNNFLCHKGEVSHIWTQDYNLSKHIALAANIPNVCLEMKEMIGNVDAILLARDDAKNHLKHAKVFLEAELPIFIDKALAYSQKKAFELWNLSTYDQQIFTSSAVRFSSEMQPEILNLEKIGNIKLISTTISNNWDKYAIHLIEAVMNLLPQRGKIIKVKPLGIETEDLEGAQVLWESGITATFQSFRASSTPLWIRVLGDKGYQDLTLRDSFGAFKAVLTYFLDVVNGDKENIPKEFTLEMIKILQKGRDA